MPEIDELYAAEGSADQATPGISILEKALIRIMDVAVSFAVLVLMLPIMAAIAVIIWIDSPGPVIFRQIRMGKNRRSYRFRQANVPIERRKEDFCSRPFVFYKFRTMYVDAAERFPGLYRYEYTDEEVIRLFFKIPDDPRLTPFGRYLRMTTLDELPNLINVIKGDMTLVGPRPDIPQMIKYYKGWQKRKFLLKPGVTGLAQVNGRGLLNFQQTLKLDVELVSNYGLGLFVKVLLKTIRVTFLRIGAF